MRLLAILAMLFFVPAVSAIDADFYLLDVSPQKVVPGETTTLNITLKNMAPGLASYVKASLDTGDTTPIDSLGSGKYFLTKKAAEAKGSELYFSSVWQNEELYISVPIYTKLGTSESVYNVPLLVEWKDELLADKSQTLYISLLVQGEIDLGIAGFITDPTIVRSGDDNVKITITFENTGEATAEDIKTGLLLESPFSPTYSQSDKSFVGRLDSDGTKSVTFFIDVEENIEPGRYTIPLGISYKDKRNQEFVQEESIDFIVEPKPYFEITRVESNPVTPKAGDLVIFYIDVKNIGHEKAESADLRVIRESGQPFLYDVRSDFIGTLKPGETGTAVLEFEIENDAVPKEHSLKLVVRCTGDTERGDSNVYTQELKATITTLEGVSQGETNLMYTGTLIFVVLIFVVLVFRVLPKLRGPKEKENETK